MGEPSREPERRSWPVMKWTIFRRRAVTAGVSRQMKYIIATLSFPSAVRATDRGFLPGDAFFHSVLTQDRCESLQSDELPVLQYVRPKEEHPALCGYAGYWKLQFAPGSQPLISNLCNLYSDFRKYTPREIVEFEAADGSTVRHETNGFHLFVYNDDFDPKRYHVALRYNESWVTDESSFVPRPDFTRLELFVEDRIAFSDDCRDAASVPQLRAKCPPIPDQEARMKLGLGNQRIESPIVVDEQIQVIVNESSDFRRYVRRRNGATLYAVTADGIKVHKIKNRKWVVSNWQRDAE